MGCTQALFLLEAFYQEPQYPLPAGEIQVGFNLHKLEQEFWKHTQTPGLGTSPPRNSGVDEVGDSQT